MALTGPGFLRRAGRKANKGNLFLEECGMRVEVQPLALNSQVFEFQL